MKRRTFASVTLPLLLGLSGCNSPGDGKVQEESNTETDIKTTESKSTELNNSDYDTESEGSDRAKVGVDLNAPDNYPKGGPGVVGVTTTGRSQTGLSYTVLLGDETLDTVSGQIDEGDIYDESYSVDFDQEDSVELRIEGDPSVVQQKSRTITLVEPRHDWNEYGGTSKNTFRNLRSWGPHHETTHQWTSEESTYGQPVVCENELYVCSTHEGSSLASLSLDTGDKLWEVETDDVFEGVTVDDGIVYFTEINAGAKTRAVTTDGDDVWEFEHDTYSNGQRSGNHSPQSALTYHVPVVNGDTVFVHSPEGGVFALHKRDGSVVWNTSEVRSICSLSADSERIYGAGPLTGDKSQTSGQEQWIWNINQDTGDVAWTTRTNVTTKPDRYVGPDGEQYDPAFRFTPPSIHDGSVHIGTSHRVKARGRAGGPIDDGNNNHLFKIDKESGEIEYKTEASHYVPPPGPGIIRVGVSAPLSTFLDFVLCKPFYSDRWYWMSPEGVKFRFISDVLDNADLAVPRNVAPVSMANGVYFLSLDNNLVQIDGGLEPHKIVEDVDGFDEGLIIGDSKIVVSGSGGIRVYAQESD
jgi:outer membrane protein assembly factor BamB